MRRSSRSWRLTAAVVAVAAVGAGVGVLASTRHGSAGPVPASRGPGVGPAAFLARYEQADGRVVRSDQGGDTVSEGQAYAMLLAVAVRDRGRFDAAWGWARANLLEGDGLLAWRWSDGHVVDSQPAADADTETGWALHLAAGAFGDPSYDRAAARLAAAVLPAETADARAGPMLVAGPWARSSPVTVDPSYLNPEATGALATVAGASGGHGDTWNRLEQDDRALLRRVMSDPGPLPPDWAQVSSGSVQAVAQPGGGSGDPRYGLDAERLPVLLAASCDSGDRGMAAALWPTLSRLADGGADIYYGLDGSQKTGLRNPVGLVAAAAGAAAAGDSGAARGLLSRADALAATDHTYYGDAWDALGRVLLTTGELSTCAPIS